MPLSPEEIQRERVLDEQLKPFGLSLSNTMKDVLSLHEHPGAGTQPFTDGKKSLEEEKIEKISVVPGNWKAALSIWIAELEKEVDNSPKYDTYAAIVRQAYNIPITKRLSAFQLYLYEPFATSLPKMTPGRHIELCLAAIARGVKLRIFIPALKHGLTGSATQGKKRQANKPITAPAIALFCKAVSETKIDPRNDDETNKDYCIRICKKYKLKYGDRVRQAFTYSGTAIHAKMVAEHILPNLQTDIQEVIDTYLKGNIRMYG